VNRTYHLAVEQLAQARRVVLYGASMAALGILREYSLPVAFLVDDTPGRAGRQLPGGIPVCSSDRLVQEDRDGLFVIISAWTRHSIVGIARKLRGMGFEEGHGFADCSILHYASVSAKLESLLGLPPNLESFSLCRSWFLNQIEPSLTGIAGTWMFTRLLDHLQGRIPGVVAECGVYRGGHAFLSLMLSPELRTRRYRLFDSFEGFPPLSPHDPQALHAEFCDGARQTVESLLTDFDNVEIYQGFFSETFPGLPEANYALVYIDCDLYASCLDCLAYFHPRLEPGGLIVLHDYWLPPQDQVEALGIHTYTGVRKACHDFFGTDRMARILALPETTHGIFVQNTSLERSNSSPSAAC
jgi:hypothetical protein